eukprot:3934461-Rhodomonas_salina.2
MSLLHQLVRVQGATMLFMLLRLAYAMSVMVLCHVWYCYAASYYAYKVLPSSLRFNALPTDLGCGAVWYRPRLYCYAIYGTDLGCPVLTCTVVLRDMRY